MMKDRYTHIFIDADDTLWENETYYREAKREFALLLSSYASDEEIVRNFNCQQEKNIPVFGYGAKTCMIGFLDTAMEMCGGSIPEKLYNDIKEMIGRLSHHKVEIIPGVEETLAALSERYTLVVATKGDLMEQVIKYRRSGLEKYFLDFSVMYNKDEQNYISLAHRFGLRPEDLLMVGNSVKSDIVPVINIGGHAIHVPHELVWEHEEMEMPDSDRVTEVENFRKIAEILL